MFQYKYNHNILNQISKSVKLKVKYFWLINKLNVQLLKYNYRNRYK